MNIEPDLTSQSQGPIDSSQYIRTYAKDLATLSGKKTANNAPPSSAPPTASVAANVSTPAENVPENTYVEESPTTLDSTEREAILARLKARAEKSSADVSSVPDTQELTSLDDIQPVPQTPTELTAAPLAAPRPPKQINRLAPRAVMPEPAPEPRVEIPEIPAAPEVLRPEPIAEPAPLHTYTSDVAKQINESHATSFSVLAAEKDAPRKPPARPLKKTNFVPILAGVLLIIIGTGALTAAYLYMKNSAPVASVFSIPTLLVPDSKVMLSGTGTTLLQAFAKQADQTIPDNTVVVTYINQATTTPQGVVEQPASGGAFITALNLPAPNILVRNIDPISTVGIAHSGPQTRAFFILRVTSYERTFAGMLEWEGNMANDLSMLYPHYPAPPPPAISSTTPVAPFILPVSAPDLTAPAAQFSDEVIANHDARVLKDGAGRTIVLYGFADKQTLIIARDEAAFTLLLARLTK
jgi:hypothetical protein